MTYVTKAVYQQLKHDPANLLIEDEPLFDEADFQKSLDCIKTVDFHQVVEFCGCKIWCYPAGHVIGACMWMLEIGGFKLLYTGDYYPENPDRHLKAAEIPPLAPDVLIVEATYADGGKAPSQKEREMQLFEWLIETIKLDGKVLIPTFSIGRLQEILRILISFWETEPLFEDIPIYYVSGVARKCMPLFEAFCLAQNEEIQNQVIAGNPWSMPQVKYMNDIRDIPDDKPCVVLASPGMMQSGVSHELFIRWMDGHNNLLLLTGYMVHGTPGKWAEEHRKKGKEAYYGYNGKDGVQYNKRMNMRVEKLTFSAHSDKEKTINFIDAIGVKNVVLVHGNDKNMDILRDFFLDQKPKLEVFTPKLTETLTFDNYNRNEYFVDITANETLLENDNEPFPSIFFDDGFQKIFVDNQTFKTGAYSSIVEFENYFKIIIEKKDTDTKFFLNFLNLTFPNFIEQKYDEKTRKFYVIIHDSVKITFHSLSLEVEWNSSATSDVIAHTIIAFANRSPFRKPSDNVFEMCDISKINYEYVVDLFTSIFGDENCEFNSEKQTLTVSIEEEVMVPVQPKHLENEEIQPNLKMQQFQNPMLQEVLDDEKIKVDIIEEVPTIIVSKAVIDILQLQVQSDSEKLRNEINIVINNIRSSVS
eukprot:TRINITY_DN1734_c0_g1_i1.p1 TRINITY_DN1734_c0_g1~~TRINITY_DN1734_c0_g1_i1.p1  ORF type:complete len:752 (+),score=207.84 TRINITY_DN1734_c0_g1_i1:329-2257(+)